MKIHQTLKKILLVAIPIIFTISLIAIFNTNKKPEYKPITSLPASPKDRNDPKYYDDLINYLKKWNEANAFNPDYAYSRGFSKFEKGDLKGAIDEYTVAIEHNMFPLELSYYGRGLAKSLLNRNWSALYDFYRAIDLNPERGAFYTARAQTKINLGFTKWIFSDLSKAKQYGDVEADSLFEKYCRPNL